jgi:hypothetical protein
MPTTIYPTAVDANALLLALTEGTNFTIPVIDLDDALFKLPSGSDSALYGVIRKLTMPELTTRTIGGSGSFDALMEGFSVHLKGEFEKSRITGAEYTKAYISLTESAMQTGLAFLLGKDQAFWAAQTAQINALTARVQLETAKMQLAAARMDAMNQQANYGLTKAKIANEDMTHVAAKFTAEFLLPQQLLNLVASGKMINEQMEGQRGQTLDTRTDGTAVVGVMGKQKALYSQQIISYQRDSEMKIGKLFSDAWITQKTIDEGTLAPASFTNASIDSVLASVKAKGGF